MEVSDEMMAHPFHRSKAFPNESKSSAIPDVVS